MIASRRVREIEQARPAPRRGRNFGSSWLGSCYAAKSCRRQTALGQRLRQGARRDPEALARRREMALLRAEAVAVHLIPGIETVGFEEALGEGTTPSTCRHSRRRAAGRRGRRPAVADGQSESAGLAELCRRCESVAYSEADHRTEETIPQISEQRTTGSRCPAADQRSKLWRRGKPPTRCRSTSRTLRLPARARTGSARPSPARAARGDARRHCCRARFISSSASRPEQAAFDEEARHRHPGAADAGATVHVGRAGPMRKRLVDAQSGYRPCARDARGVL